MGSSNYNRPPPAPNPNFYPVNYGAPAQYQKTPYKGGGGMFGALGNMVKNLEGQREFQKNQQIQNDQNMMNAYNAGNTYTPQTMGPSFSSTSNENINPFFGNYANF